MGEHLGRMGAGCTKDAKAGVVDLQNGNVPATPRTPAKTNVKTEGENNNHDFDLLLMYGPPQICVNN